MARNILLVRMDGIGDALALAPLVAALRDAGHRLAAVLATPNRDAYVAGTFAQVHVLERIPWPQHGSTKATYARALVEAQASAYDVALIASEEPEAYRFAREARIATRVGFTNGFEKPLKSLWARMQLTRALVRPASAEREREHEVETLFRLGAGLHGEAAPTRDPARLRPLVVGDVAPHGRVVVQLTRKLDALGLQPDALRAALRDVARAHPTVAVAAPHEAPYARELAASSGLDLQLTDSLPEWKALIAGASAVVTPDSGAAHVAGMTGVGCVDLFPDAPDVGSALRRWYPWASPRAWTVPVTRRVAEQLASQLLAGIAYVSLATPVELGV
jgi:ADP-heptose:LPS heptosyltransferase